MKFLVLLLSTIAGISTGSLYPESDTSVNGRVIGGSDLADTINTPFVAAIYHAGPGFLCAGVIVDVNWILTTADCVYAYSFEDPVETYAEVGGVKLNTIEAGKLQLNLARIVIHPDFHSREMIYYNNVALMKTSFIISENAHIAHIALPPIEAIVPGTSGFLAGWGGSNNQNPTTNLQLSTRNTVLDFKTCQQLSGMVINKQLCTDPTISASACKYDHGSPLYRLDSVLGSVLLGLVNYAPCTTINYPTVYTSVPDYVDWIRIIMR